MFRKSLSFLLALVLVFSLGQTQLFPLQPARAEGALPVLVGFYPSGNLYNTIGELDTLNTYFGKPTISLAGNFIDFESPNWLIIDELNTAWDHGYVPFINLAAGTAGTPYTAQQIANGAIDSAVRNWAQIFKTWSNAGQKRAFIAPLQEMNGYWTTYYGDSSNFRRAYVRIRQIFQEEGVPANAVSWVFAPNGWNDPAKPEDAFENYYPGNSVVDVVGFSSFNFGDCWPYTNSQGYDEIYKPYLDRMAAMAPGKPIFVAEIGSVAYGLDRAAWFTDTLSQIGAYPGVRAILYFNRTESANYLYSPACNRVDYSLDSAPDGLGGPAAEGKEAFKAQVTSLPYGYWAPASTEMTAIAFNRPTVTFEDVWAASVFSGKSNTPYYQPWVERLVNANITSGYTSVTMDFTGVSAYTYRYYYPDYPVTRAQMAVFLEKGKHYPAAFTPPVVTPTFPDTVGHWAADWIEALKADSITAGFPDGTYRPEDSVTRAQMAVFLLKAINGSSYTPPEVTPSFSDTAGHWAANWIEALKTAGITSGFPDGTYRPEDAVTRGQMAVFLSKAFGLP